MTLIPVNAKNLNQAITFRVVSSYDASSKRVRIESGGRQFATGRAGCPVAPGGITSSVSCRNRQSERARMAVGRFD
jgi:hypothetical protein